MNTLLKRKASARKTLRLLVMCAGFSRIGLPLSGEIQIARRAHRWVKGPFSKLCLIVQKQRRRDSK
jgi:hypothetical protein